MVIFNLPNTRDPDTDAPCYNECDVQELGQAASYENNTRKLIIYPNKLRSMDDFLVKCEVVDYGIPTKKKIRYFFLSFIRPDEHAKQLGNKNLLILSPYIESFSDSGLINVQFGYNFTPGLEKWMIDQTVMKFIVTPKENKRKPYDLNWTTTDISHSSFKVQLRFKDPLSLTYKDVLSMKFI